MKILCVCERGNSRSVCMAFLFKDMLHQDALAVGLTSSSEDTKRLLYEWADVIILVAGSLVDMIPDAYRGKLMVWDVGEDVYFQGFHQDLIDKCLGYMQKHLTVSVT